MNTVQHILVINVTRIGDTLFATPAIRAVAAAFLDARITVLGHPKRTEVFEHLPFIHEVGSITKGRAVWHGWLGGKKYDLAFVFGFDKALVAYALRTARRVVAFEQQHANLNRSLFSPVPKPPFQSKHAVRQLLRLPGALGIAPAGLRIAYHVTDNEIAAARHRLDAVAPDARPLIGLQIASFHTKSYRDWPVEHFSALAQQIGARWHGAHFLLFGGKAEQPRVRQLAADLGAHATVLAGRLSLRETAALMSQLDLYVGVDTGPTHIMSAFDIPMIGLYHCLSSSSLTGPLEHPLCDAIDHPDSGSACSEASSMADISVAHVFSRVERILGPIPESKQ